MNLVAAFTDGMKNPVESTLIGYFIFIWVVGNLVYHLIREWLNCGD